MFIKLNDRVFLNKEHITRIKIDEVKDGIRVRFYRENTQIAKSKVFAFIKDAQDWICAFFPELA